MLVWNFVWKFSFLCRDFYVIPLLARNWSGCSRPKLDINQELVSLHTTLAMAGEQSSNKAFDFFWNPPPLEKILDPPLERDNERSPQITGYSKQWYLLSYFLIAFFITVSIDCLLDLSQGQLTRGGQNIFSQLICFVLFSAFNCAFDLPLSGFPSHFCRVIIWGEEAERGWFIPVRSPAVSDSVALNWKNHETISFKFQLCHEPK